MSLQSELDAFKSAWTSRVGDDIATLVDTDNAALQDLADRAVKEGAAFPAPTLRNHKGGVTDLGALMAESALIVTFYRGGWCPYCNLELRAYQALLPEITARGARLVAVSPETPDNTLTTAETNALLFEVLSDTEGRLADALRIRYELTAPIKALYQKFGHDLPVRNGDGRWSLPMPATYVVAKGGRILLAHVSPDYRTRLEPEAALAALTSPATVAAA
ncbi:putative AhpC/Tsa family protein, selenocysteine-containing oxidoreductase [Bradyrhizobium sp. ORS 278]|uniref:peroxiredoxin-like family protein n=1 Tax=Bradyrhizobium sp. (strain ORS 278) TaxID=114615 RepID=UPI000150812B|nr:peroxiredoxin-like family protein [Bradyrhizobium sp. ORS 278]CAL77480.1 putative AhpC/Tsa family protein, selenocysteine-containing oxidoreductase [Bradyrhizobium sp. ORS 278]